MVVGHEFSQLIHDRHEAGCYLAHQLKHYAHHPDGIVLGLPRGGVPIAHTIAQALGLPLDICLVRKLGLPRSPETAMGAIAANGVRVLNQAILAGEGITNAMLTAVTTQELAELERRDHRYRGSRPHPDLAAKTVILVDDGLATGATMQAAIAIVKQQSPDQIIVAVPVAPRSVCAEIAVAVDQVICWMQPEPFEAIGQWYENFTQVSDEEVCRLLAQNFANNHRGI